ncbi:MAG: phosphate signaling complex protein PhoU [Clostridia bacterium]|nr:MAG: phosphate signaling complex protein PhoU [Clostridia bacterium]
MSGNPRQTFENALTELQQDILRMGSLVEQAIATSLTALVRQDEELAQKVVDNDQVIDKLELQIEDRCIKLLATQQPMAKDLRKISAGFKIISDLERMGDHACDIAKTVHRIGKKPFIKPLIDLPRMGELAQRMVKESLDAYVEESVDLAYSMSRDDDLVDHLHAQIFRELLTYMMEDPRTIEQATHLLFVSRYLERIADHATNIGERVIYLVTGELHELND